MRAEAKKKTQDMSEGGNSADDDDTVFFKCTGCGGQLSYVVERPKVEPEPKVEVKAEVKTEAPPATPTPGAKSSPQPHQQQSPAPPQQLMSPKSKASSAALRSFRKQKQTVSESTSQQQPQEKKVGSLTIKPAVSPAPQVKPVLSGKPKAFGATEMSRISAASKSPPSSLTISNVSNKMSSNCIKHN